MDLNTISGLEEFIDEIVTPMRANIERDGELSPFAVICARRNPKSGQPLEKPEAVIVALTMEMMRNAETKTATRAVLDGLLASLDGVGIAFVTESWIVKIPESEGYYDYANTPPSKHPLRIEIVSVICEHKSGGAIFYYIPIVRSEKLVTLGEPMKHHTGRPEGGSRFGNFFGQARSIEA